MDQGHSRILQLEGKLARSILRDNVSGKTRLKDASTIILNGESVDIVDHTGHLAGKLIGKSRSPLVVFLRLVNIKLPRYQDDVAGKLSEGANEFPHLIR